MGADADLVKGALMWREGTAVDRADRALRAASHRHAHAKGDAAKALARQELRRAAVVFVAEAQKLVGGGE